MSLTCPYCSKPAELVTGAQLYPHRDDLKALNFWRCAPCDAYVGCHGGTEAPLGRLANATLRQAKRAAHTSFDALWRGAGRGKARDIARGEAYRWLSGVMKLPPDKTHIGMFDDAQCAEVVRLCAGRVAAMMAAEMMEK